MIAPVNIISSPLAIVKIIKADNKLVVWIKISLVSFFIDSFIVSYPATSSTISFLANFLSESFFINGPTTFTRSPGSPVPTGTG